VLEYQETIRLKPDDSAAHRGLGRALEKAGRLAEAEAAYAAGLDATARTGDLQTRRRSRPSCAA
jgi:Flp pilus assembly protein TadD